MSEWQQARRQRDDVALRTHRYALPAREARPAQTDAQVINERRLVTLGRQCRIRARTWQLDLIGKAILPVLQIGHVLIWNESKAIRPVRYWMAAEHTGPKRAVPAQGVDVQRLQVLHGMPACLWVEPVLPVAYIYPARLREESHPARADADS